MLENCLSSRHLFHSDSLEETVERCSQILWPHRMNILQQHKHVSTVVDGIFHNELTLIYIKHGAEVAIDTGDNENYYLVQYNLAGNGKCKCGKQTENTTPQSATILSHNLHSIMHYNDQTEQLVLKLNKQTVESYLENLILSPLNEPLVFDLKMRPDSAAIHICVHF